MLALPVAVQQNLFQNENDLQFVKLVDQSQNGNIVLIRVSNKANFDGRSTIDQQHEDQVVEGQMEYLVDFGEETAPNKLRPEVFPEFQFAHSSAELLPAVHMVVLV